MSNFVWLLQSVEDKMDVSQDFTDSPRKQYRSQMCMGITSHQIDEQ